MLIFTDFIKYVMGGWSHIGKAFGIGFAVFALAWLLFTFTNEDSGFYGEYIRPKTNGFTIFLYLTATTAFIFVSAVCAAASVDRLIKDFRETDKQMQIAAEKSFNEVFPEDTRKGLKEMEEQTGVSLSDLFFEPEESTKGLLDNIGK